MVDCHFLMTDLIGGDYGLISDIYSSVSNRLQAVADVMYFYPAADIEAIGGFCQVSASAGDEVWAISNNCIACRRLGITSENPAGSSWILGLPVCIDFVCVVYYFL